MFAPPVTPNVNNLPIPKLSVKSNRSRVAFNLRRGFVDVCVGVCLMLVVACSTTHAQSGKAKNPAPDKVSVTSNSTLLTRRTTRREVRRFPYGSSLALLGAPAGSVTIEAWSRPEIEIEADIESRAASEADLDQLALVNNFIVDAESPNRIQILTVGTHDRKYLKRVAKNFPKRLLNADWKINYRLRVPALIDLELNTGRGAVRLTGMEGSLRLTAIEGDVTLGLAGGDLAATVGTGTITLRPTSRSWRGRGVDVRLGSGTFNVELPADFNAAIDANVLRTGRIEQTYPGLTAPDDNSLISSSTTSTTSTNSTNATPITTAQTPSLRTLRVRAGTGGTPFVLTIGDGLLRILPATPAASSQP